MYPSYPYQLYQPQNVKSRSKRFKPCDLVVCVDDSRSMGYLKQGNVYIVAQHVPAGTMKQDSDKHGIIVLGSRKTDNRNDPFVWDANRFKLVGVVSELFAISNGNVQLDS